MWFASDHKVRSNANAAPSGSAHAVESYWFWLLIHRETPSDQDQTAAELVTIDGAVGLCLFDLVRWLGVSFFICNAHRAKHVMNGGKSAVEMELITKFGQCQVRRLLK